MPELCQKTDEKDEINEANGIYIRNKRAIRKQKCRKTSQYTEAKESWLRGGRFGFAYYAGEICGL